MGLGFDSQLKKNKKYTQATTLLKEQKKKRTLKKKRFYLFIRVAMLHKHIYSSLWLFFFMEQNFLLLYFISK